MIDPLVHRYDEEASDYLRCWEPVLRPMGCRLVDRLPLTGARTVLDIGTGAGGLLEQVRLRAASACLVGVDPSAGMLKLAAGRGPDLLMQATAEQLPFRTGRFDAVIMVFMLFHLSDPAAGLREASRVLRTGAVLGLAVWGDQPDYPALDYWNEALDRLGAPPDPITWVRHHEWMNTADRLAALVEPAGFSTVETWTETYEHRWDIDSFLEFRTTVGPSRRRFEALQPERRKQLTSDIRDRFGSAGPEMLTYRPQVVYLAARSAEKAPTSEFAPAQ